MLKNALDSMAPKRNHYVDATHVAHQWHPDLNTDQEREHERYLGRITPCEMEFLLLVNDEAELTTERIADRMGVHRRTVDDFRITLIEKSLSSARYSWWSSPCAVAC